MNRDQIAEVIGRHLAIHVSRNRMPHMSGDPRMRLPDHVREDFDCACQEAADAIIALDGWQTIDSAPRDGTRVLTFSPTASKFGYAAITDNVFRRGAWQRSSRDTHWRPIPQPPGDDVK